MRWNCKNCFNWGNGQHLHQQMKLFVAKKCLYYSSPLQLIWVIFFLFLFLYIPVYNNSFYRWCVVTVRVVTHPQWCAMQKSQGRWCPQWRSRYSLLNLKQTNRWKLREHSTDRLHCDGEPVDLVTGLRLSVVWRV